MAISTTLAGTYQPPISNREYLRQNFGVASSSAQSLQGEIWGEGDPLGNHTKLPSTPILCGSAASERDRQVRQERRRGRYKLLGKIKQNLKKSSEILKKNHGRLLACGDFAAVRKDYDGKLHERNIEIVRSIEHGAAHYAGLAVCGDVWGCPVCSAKIKARRAVEVAEAFDFWLSGEGSASHHVAMLTLTHSHSRDDSLESNISRHNAAKTRLWSGRFFQDLKRDFGIKHWITGAEVTYGDRHGWHWHQHVLLFYSGSSEKMAEAKSNIQEAWINACSRAGFEIDDKTREDMMAHAVDLMVECSSTDYLVKSGLGEWGADREVGGSDAKRARGDRYTPFALADAGRWELYSEYLDATKGRQQLRWSRGFKALVGLKDKTDAELAEEVREKGVVLAVIPKSTWQIVVERKWQCFLLEIAEIGGVDVLFQFAQMQGLRLLQPPDPPPDG